MQPVLRLPVFCLLAGLSTGLVAGSARISARPFRPAARRAAEAYLRLPLAFERNTGQAGPAVSFLSRGPGYQLSLSPGETVLSMSPASSAPVKRAGVLRTRLLGAARHPRVAGLEPLPGRVNYLIGRDPKQWRTNVPTYAKVEYQRVYPGVDLVYYGSQQQLEYDFRVRPGADPRAISFRVEGADRAELAANGDLLLKTPAGEARQHRPVAYQVGDAGREPVPARYELASATSDDAVTVRFHLGAYDRSRPLVIDPVISYSTYFGGSGATNSYPTANLAGLYNQGDAIAVDALGNAYVTGTTSAPDFPHTNTLGNGPQPSRECVFVTKINTNASGAASLVYSTFIGGTHSSSGLGVALDAAQNVLLTGQTTGVGFPYTYAFDFSSADPKVFVARLAADGSSLPYCALLGFGYPEALAAGNAGEAYVTGYTGSSAFVTRNGYLTTDPHPGAPAAFLARLDTFRAGDDSLLYSTFLGGDDESIGWGVAADLNGRAYVCGRWGDTRLGRDAFVAILDTTLAGAASLTWLNRPGGDFASRIARGSDGSLYVIGHLTEGGALARPHILHGFPYEVGRQNQYFVRLDPTQTGDAAVLYCTACSGATGIAVVDPTRVWITGLPLGGPITDGGTGATVVARLDTTADGAASVGYSAILGTVSTAGDASVGIAVDPQGNPYVAGFTRSTDLPVVNGFSTYPGTAGTTATVGWMIKLRMAVPANQAPVAAADSYSGWRGCPLRVPAPGVLGNDTDADGGSLTAAMTQGPAHGSLVLNTDGSFSYTPNAGTTGDSFTYRAFDGTDYSTPATVTLTLATDATRPTCTFGASVAQSSPALVYVPATVADSQSGVVSVQLTTNSTNCKLADPVTGQEAAIGSPLTYDPSLASRTLRVVKLNTAQSARVELRVTDCSGNTLVTDPVAANLELARRRLTRVFRKLPAAEHLLRFDNGTPGVSALQLWVNGHRAYADGVSAGQTIRLDLAPWMRPGNRNTVRLVVSGPAGSTASLMIGDESIAGRRPSRGGDQGVREELVLGR